RWKWLPLATFHQTVDQDVRTLGEGPVIEHLSEIRLQKLDQARAIIAVQVSSGLLEYVHEVPVILGQRFANGPELGEPLVEQRKRHAMRQLIAVVILDISKGVVHQNTGIQDVDTATDRTRMTGFETSATDILDAFDVNRERDNRMIRLSLPDQPSLRCAHHR